MALLVSFFFYLLAIPTGQPSLWQAISGSLLLCAGTMMAVITLSRLGRSFSMMPEARRLITTAPYAIVRHPMYLSEQIAIAGLWCETSPLLLGIVHGALLDSGATDEARRERGAKYP